MINEPRFVEEPNEDWIIIVPEKSIIDKPITDWFGWEKAVKYKRVVPFHSKVVKMFYKGKVKNKEEIEYHLVIDTGITLEYKGEQWREESGVIISLPFQIAKEVAEATLRTLKKVGKAMESVPDGK